MKITTILIIVIFTLTSCQYDGAREIIKSSEYKGVIIHTYREKFNHNAAVFVIKMHDSSLEMNPDSWPNLWEYAKIGDSIIKQKDTLLIIVIKNDSTKEEFFYDPFRRGMKK